MRPASVAADLGHVLIRVRDADTSVSGRNDSGKLVLADPRLIQNILQDLIRALSALGSGPNHIKSNNLFILIQNHGIGRCRSAVYSQNVHFLTSCPCNCSLLLPHFRFLNGFQKCFHTCSDLPLTLGGGICLCLQDGDARSRAEFRILKCIHITELDRMADQTIQPVFETVDKLLPAAGLYHSKAGNLVEQIPGISAKRILLPAAETARQAGAGHIKENLRVMVFQYIEHARAAAGADKTDPGPVFLLRRLAKLFGFCLSLQNLGELLLIKLFAGEILISPNHLPEIFRKHPGRKIIDLAGHIDHVDELVRALVPQDVTKPADAVTAGGQDDALIIAADYFLQDRLDKGAHIGVHQSICLIKIDHGGRNASHFCFHGFKDFYRRIFTHKSKHLTPPPSDRSSPGMPPVWCGSVRHDCCGGPCRLRPEPAWECPSPASFHAGA